MVFIRMGNLHYENVVKKLGLGMKLSVYKLYMTSSK